MASKTSNERNRSVATPSTKPSAHELGERLVVAKLEARPQLVGRRRHTKDRLSSIKRDVEYGTEGSQLGSHELCGLCACLRSTFAHFFAVAKVPTHCRYNTSLACVLVKDTGLARIK